MHPRVVSIDEDERLSQYAEWQRVRYPVKPGVSRAMQIFVAVSFLLVFAVGLYGWLHGWLR